MDNVLTDRNLKRCAVVGLVVTAVLTVATFSTGALKLFERTYKVTAMFPDAAGLSAGDRVRVAGVDVGSVAKLERIASKRVVKAELELQAGTEVSADTRASIRLRSLLGAKFVDLDDDGNGPKLRPGGVIPLERTDVPADLDELLNAVGGFVEPLDVDAMNRVLGSFGEALNGRGEQLGTLVDRLGVLAGELSERSGDIDRLLTAGERLGSAVASRDDEIATSTDQLATLLGALSARREQLTQVVAGVERVTAQMTPLLA